jgi:tetratricopeptide (TPR) repeat protein
MSRDTLKEEARKHEQNEDWAKALDFYLQALGAQAEGEEPDIALYNRVGDLQVRIGDVDGAVGNYERAIDLYLEAELPNNAIAVCRKISRNDAKRPSPFLKMGQIRAAQGFVVDARQNFLTYAEMMQGRGKTDEALRALEEFVGLVKDDVETRVFLGEQLVVRERVDEAVKFMAQAVRTLMRRKDTEGAQKLAARIQEIAPGHAIPSGEEESAPAAPGDGGLAFETTALDARASRTAAPTEAPQDFGFSDIALGSAETKEEEEAAPASAGDAPSGDFNLSFGDSPAAAETEEPVADIGGDLPLMAFPDDDEEEASGDSDALPLLDLTEALGGAVEDAVDEKASAAEAAPAMELDMGDFASEGSTGAAADLRARVEKNPDDAEGWRLLGRQLYADGDDSGGRTALGRSETAFAARRDHRSAIEVVREMVRKDPRNTDLKRRLVELAYETNDRGLLVESFLELADGLAEAGNELKAEAVYRQVLSLDAHNAKATAAVAKLSRAAGAPAAPPSSPKATDPDYVDLGSLVLDGGEEKTTRWVVSAGAPSGDEQADFSKMLSQFKDKVAQNLSSEDARSHYDLGTAYKEMGLVDEAIEEFQRALRAEPTNLATFEMLGQCFLDKGEPQAAIRTLDRGLKLPTQVEDDLLGIYYFIARSKEALGDVPSAREFYEKIFSLDINFKDVTERLRSLR